MKTTKVLFITLLITAMVTMPQGAMSQVTIGADKSPETFSVLELISNGTNKGLRLPQLTTTQRNALVLTGNDLARGLTIFNSTTRCLEYWAGNVDGWKQQCGPGGPAADPPVPPGLPDACGITTIDNKTFACKADLAAELYQFFSQRGSLRVSR
ncbi:MAG: hypothetical protein LBT04_09020 [Prevotellaceae bacterium]|nr:hypothetical protein [Prevotellaceae bacterium]